jgi:hypothetical protein
MPRLHLTRSFATCTIRYRYIHPPHRLRIGAFGAFERVINPVEAVRWAPDAKFFPYPLLRHVHYQVPPIRLAAFVSEPSEHLEPTYTLSFATLIRAISFDMCQKLFEYILFGMGDRVTLICF